MTDEQQQGRASDAEKSRFWMQMRRNRTKTRFARRPSPQEAARREVMRDWYGDDRAAGEIRARERPACPVGEVVSAVFRELHRYEDLTVASLQNTWSTICGGELARQTWPVALRGNRCLVIEVRDPGWLYSLANYQKQDILGAVQSSVGEQVRDVAFIPAGRRRPEAH